MSRLREIARDAEFSPTEADHFVSGLRGETVDSLEIDRERYNLVQALVERGILESNSGKVVAKKPLAYMTKKPPTPFRLDWAGRPRGRLMRDILRNGLGTSVIDGTTFKVIQANKELGIYRHYGRIAEALARKGSDSCSVTSEEVAVQQSFMAVDGEIDGDAVKVVFTAKQVPSDEAGSIIFGDVALGMFELTGIIHERNLLEGRGGQYISDWMFKD